MTHDVISAIAELLIGFKTIRGIEAALVTTFGGVNLASMVPPKTNPDTLAAMSSALQNAAEIMTSQMKKGSPDRIVIECEHNKLLVMSAGPKALFVVLANQNINLGPLLVEMNSTANKIAELMKGT